jgi:hypothetical protein
MDGELNQHRSLTLSDNEIPAGANGSEGMENEESMAERFTLPVLPLRDTVVYPGVAVPISAGRAGTVEAVQEALDGDRRLFAVAQRENVDDPAPEYLYSVGTVVRIIQTHRVRGGVQLLVQGEGRAQAVSYHQEGEAMLHAVLLDMETMDPQDYEDPAFQALDQELRDRAAELGTRRGVPAEALNQLIQGVDEPGPFADLVAFYLELETADKQGLLELLDDEERMRACLLAVERELARIDAQEDIQAKVQSELGERQREMLLREQLKAIQKELGEEEERDDVEEMQKRIAELDLSEDQRAEVDRELRRLERTSPQSAEYQVIRTFLEWVTELPWNERSEEKIDLENAEEILHEDHYGLEDVKDRVLEFLAVRKLALDRSSEEEAAAEKSIRRPWPDPALRRTSGRGEDVDRSVDRPVTGAGVRPDFSGWCPRRGGYPGPSPYLRRCDARPDHSGDASGEVEEPCLPVGRGRQARRLVPGRSELGAPRGPGPGAELDLRGSLPGDPVRPVRGPLRRDGELPRSDSGPPPRSYGAGRLFRIYGGREARDREAVPASSAAEGEQPHGGRAPDEGRGDPDHHSELYP